MITDEQRAQAIEYNEQAKLLQKVGNVEEAFNYYEKARAIDPMFIETYINRASLLTIGEQLDEAEESYKKALMIDKHDGRIYFHLGNIAFIKRNISLGIEYYNKAIYEGYTDAKLYYYLGMIYEEEKDVDMALKNYSRAIHKDPNVPEYRIHKATLQISKHMYEEALFTLDGIMRITPDVFEGYHYSFEILCLLGRYEDAKVIIDKAINLFPEDVSLFYDAIRYHTFTGQTDKALEMIEEAKHMEGFEIEERNLTLEQARLYTTKNELYKATEFYEKCKDFEKEGNLDLEARYLLMNLLLVTEKYDSLLNNANEVLEKESNNTQIIYIRATYYYQAFALQKLGRLEEAEKKYKEAITIYRQITLHNPTFIDAYMFRVLCHKNRKEYSKAIELVEFVQKLQETAEGHILKSDIYRDMGDEEIANEELELAYKMKPTLENQDRRLFL